MRIQGILQRLHGSFLEYLYRVFRKICVIYKNTSQSVATPLVARQTKMLLYEKA